MTGTVSQGEDEYRGAQRMIRKYGADHIRHVTYPDNFMTEQEAMISQLLNLAADPKIKAIVFAQGVPGSMAAMKRIDELRPDIEFLIYEPHEDPHQVSEYADVSIITDNLKRGETIVELAHEMGAKTFVHYSFPRHMSQELISRRMKIMEETCQKLGMEFVFANAPDPTGDQGLPGAQKFILEDVPREIEKYGTDTAFFSTNCGMQEPLIRSCADNHAIMPEQCCPSPTHGYPGALGIAIAEGQAGDMGAIRNAIQEKVVAAGNSGRMATWPVSTGIVGIEALTEIAIQSVQGKVRVNDPDVIVAELQKAAGAKVTVHPFEDVDNYYMFLMDSVIF
ncbi:MAG: DUF3798 domain-containing protein [Candidatus Eisenbacteria bacterium]|uniref:DUF3798 domain-containing protein n=1 Tax=Eiseniibacteriota bacterium TaxID=2212470 RepID=A0A956M0U1_UNCEI|nr:DUF3798 domain-containing protein [Candidatus Eisenbacteria bacterium]